MAEKFKIYGDGATPLGLASSAHSWGKLQEAMEGATDMGLNNPVGVGWYQEIPELKDQALPKVFVPRLEKYKSGYYYLRKLNRRDRMSCLKYMRIDCRGFYPVRYKLEDIYKDLEDFITSAIFWAGTSEGLEYWGNKAAHAR